MTAGHLDYIDQYGIIKYRDTNGWVKPVQRFFNSVGYKLVTDGIFGKMTFYVVKDFQRHCDLKSDGIIGDNTKAKMLKYDGYDHFCPEVFEPIFGNIESVDCCQLEKYCLNRGLSGLSWAFMNGQVEHGVNVLHNIAHAILESASGTSHIARRKNNLYGFKAYDSSPYASAGRFADYPDCINTWTKWFKEQYLLPTGRWHNGNSEQGVNVKYATSPIAGINKAFIVKDLRGKLYG